MPLTILIFVPLLGAAALLLQSDERAIWSSAFIFSLIPLALSCYLFAEFDRYQAGYQFVEQYQWIPQFGISYHLGMDGISLFLVLLTTILITLSLLYSGGGDIEMRPREFCFLMLFLESGLLGTFLALNIQAPAAESFGLRGALWLATAIMGVGFSSYFVYLAMERVARGKIGAPGVTATGGIAQEEKFVLRDAFSFDASFWFISLLCVTFYSAVFPFQAYAPDILVQKFGYSVTTAGHITSALIFGTMIFTPILGWVVDRKGKRATMMIFGALLLVPCHVLIGYTHFTPIVPIFFVGVALSLVPAALWAAIPMMVPESRLGTAFGVVGYVQNLGLWLFPMLAGMIADAHTTTVNGQPVVDYTSTMLMFVGLGVAGFLFSLLLKAADARRKEGLSIEAVMLH